MVNELIAKLISREGPVDPPGCLSCFVEHPNSTFRQQYSVEVGLMLEHRFAFTYWIRCKQELIRSSSGGSKVPDSQFMPPDLVTWDWHDDCGADADVIESELDLLNQSDRDEVAIYAWRGLAVLNDGQILPAVWLNALRNVYIVQKQKRDCLRMNQRFKDRFGREHQIYYFRTLTDFAETFRRTTSNSGTIWDIDLDYFTRTRDVPDQRFNPPWPAKRIHELLSFDTPWMPLILNNLKAITIALEPEYTGGLIKSLELFKVWESALFTTSLFEKSCHWRHG